MRATIAECIFNKEAGKGDTDLHFELSQGGCLDLYAGKDDVLLARICDVDDFLAVAKGIEDFYWKNKIGNKV